MLFCVEEPTDPAVMVVNSLLEKYPKVDATLFIGKPIGLQRYLDRQSFDSAGERTNQVIALSVVVW